MWPFTFYKPFKMVLKFLELFISFVFLMHQPPAHVGFKVCLYIEKASPLSGHF